MARQTVMTRRAVAAATAGSTIEFYDFLLYGVVAALVFPEVFFPRQNPYAGVLPPRSVSDGIETKDRTARGRAP